MQANLQLPGNSRQMLRDAVRNHPSSAQYLKGRRVNALTKDELLDIASLCQIDAADIVAQASLLEPSRPAARPQAQPDSQAQPAQDEDEAQDEAQDEDEAPEAQAAKLAAEAEALRVELTQGLLQGNFQRVTDRIAGLLAEANKPPVVEIQTVYAQGPAPTDAAAALAVPRPVRAETWHALFGTSGAAASRRINVYAPSPHTPPVDTKYRWPEHVTEAALSAFQRGRSVWLYGPAGTGKSTFGEQLAARTGRPFFLVACDDTTEAPELIGMTTPHAGSTRWQDGILTAAIRVPHAIILIDEPTVARAGALMVLQSVLASRVLSIKETGELVRVADGVRFICADNTNGTGGGGAAGYEGTRRMNRAMLDRFASFLALDYMDPVTEADVLVAHTGCTLQLARILVDCAGLTRKARVTHAIGLRRLIAWAEALTDGIDPRKALEYCILNSCARDDREPTEQCCALGLDKTSIAAAITGRAPMSAAARDFSA